MKHDAAAHYSTCLVSVAQVQQYADDHGLGKAVAGMYFYVRDDQRGGEG